MLGNLISRFADSAAMLYCSFLKTSINIFVKAPGAEEKPWEEVDDLRELSARESSVFRSFAARANYLALDRCDIQYSTKELCRGMAKPTVGDMKKLKRLGRYLLGVPRVVSEFKFQGACHEFTAHSDSDWAGCRRTARSTSSRVIKRGAHLVKSWSLTQKFVTLSSAEAELMAAVKATAETIGMTQLAESWGCTSQVRCTPTRPRLWRS